jgi:hypothetical protein
MILRISTKMVGVWCMRGQNIYPRYHKTLTQYALNPHACQFMMDASPRMVHDDYPVTIFFSATLERIIVRFWDQ